MNNHLKPKIQFFRKLQLEEAVQRRKLFGDLGDFGFEILIVLCDANEDDSNRGINISSLSNILDAPRRTIRRRLTKMETFGWITIEARKSETRVEITPFANRFLDDWITEAIRTNAKAMQRIQESKQSP
jgi:DNA-binding IclR family transcriptional regulator